MDTNRRTFLGSVTFAVVAPAVPALASSSALKVRPPLTYPCLKAWLPSCPFTVMERSSLGPVPEFRFIEVDSDGMPVSY